MKCKKLSPLKVMISDSQKQREATLESWSIENIWQKAQKNIFFF